MSVVQGEFFAVVMRAVKRRGMGVWFCAVVLLMGSEGETGEVREREGGEEGQ